MKFENDAIDTIVAIINDDVEKYTSYKQRENFENDLIYANGNDGTEFDWENNNRLCEFVYWHKNGSCAMRCLVERSGDVEVYLYPEGEIEPTHSEVHKGALLGYEVEDLYFYLMKEVELLVNPIYDAPVQEIFKYTVEPSDIQYSTWSIEDDLFATSAIIDGENVSFNESLTSDDFFAGWLEHFGVDDYDEYKEKVVESLNPDCDESYIWENIDWAIFKDFGRHVIGDLESFIDETEAGKEICQELADSFNDYIEDYYDGKVTCTFK